MGQDGSSEPPKTIQDYWTDVCDCFCWKSNKNVGPNINACFTDLQCLCCERLFFLVLWKQLRNITISSWQIHPAGSASIRQHPPASASMTPGQSLNIDENRWSYVDLPMSMCWTLVLYQIALASGKPVHKAIEHGPVDFFSWVFPAVFPAT